MRVVKNPSIMHVEFERPTFGEFDMRVFIKSS